MTGTELQKRLDAAERSARWLADKLGRSHTQVGRWLSGDQPVPDGRAREIRALLVPVRVVSRVEVGAIVRPLDGVLCVQPGTRYIVRKSRNWRGRPTPVRCRECNRAFEPGELVATDVNGNGRHLCLRHVRPLNDDDQET